MAGGSRESQQTIKQTEHHYFSVLLLLLTFIHTHLNSPPSIHWVDFCSICSIHWWHWCCLEGSCDCLSGLRAKRPYFCLYQFHPKSGRLFIKSSRFPRSSRAASIKKWRKINQLDSMGLTVPTLPIIFGMDLGHFMPLISWIPIFGIELRLSLPCLDWMSI